MMYFVSIRLIRDSTDSSRDDQVKVYREDNNIHVKYVDRELGSAVTTHLNLVDTGLSGYVESLLDFFMNDEQPFKQIQFNFPGFPMLLASHDSLTADFRKKIGTVAAIVCESWFADCNRTFGDEWEL